MGTKISVGRRGMLKLGLTTGLVAQVASSGASARTVNDKPAQLAFDKLKDRIWIGPDFWSNRFQDWRLKGGVAECLTGASGDELRTLGLLTRDIEAGGQSARLAASFTPLSEAGKDGFGGFLIGVGAGKLDYRAAALAQRGSGENGGFMAVVDTFGQVSFLDHTSEDRRLQYPRLDSENGGSGSREFVSGGLRLVVEIESVGSSYDVLATATSIKTGEAVSFARRSGVTDAELIGGLSLLSSANIGADGARWGISDFECSGDKVGVHPGRALGPVMGSMYTLSGNTLKLSAQFMPIGGGDPTEAVMEYRKAGSRKWKTGKTSPILDGYTALFREEQWDGSRDWDIRIVWPGSSESLWTGTVRAEPDADGELVTALYSCISSTGRSLEGGSGKRPLPQERYLGMFAPENFYFPHNDMRRNTMAHNPDVLLVVGDQYYEGNPIRLGRELPTRKIDTMYRWYLWYWSFREIMRARPTIMMLDDHDVLHGNIWGEGGIDSPNQEQNRGGYAWGADFVRMVHRMQTSHNPDAHDATPIANDIPVSYCEWYYGGVSFSIIEDRKWKTTPMHGADLDVHVAQLLGERQEQFLKDWKDMHPGAPKMVVTQSVWGCPQTSPKGEAVVDFDSNGYPPLARRNAVKLVKDAGAVMVAGDQHLGMALRHGIDDYADGPFQFSGPAGGAYWQRWFESGTSLSNMRTGFENTGDFMDGFGNKMRVLAVANPKVTFEEFRKHVKIRSQAVKDPEVKSEGYGIVRISKANSSFTFECWSKEEDPTRTNAHQYPGWPLTVSFDDA